MTTQTLIERPSTATGNWTCPSCSHEVAGWRSTCDQCRSTKDGNPVALWDGKRPRGLSAYIIFMVVVATSLIILLVSMGAHKELIGLGAIAIISIEFIIAWGLWNLRNWARITVIVLRSLTMLIGLISLFIGSFASILTIVVSFVIVRWFFNNGHIFQPKH